MAHFHATEKGHAQQRHRRALPFQNHRPHIGQADVPNADMSQRHGIARGRSGGGAHSDPYALPLVVNARPGGVTGVENDRGGAGIDQERDLARR